jgi:Coenzyme PQQ synthesis protein D (PqqD)
VDFLEKVFKKSDAIVFRKIGDECILVPIRQGVGDLESIYTLNETGARIWELVDGTAKGTEIRDRIIEEFDVTLEEAEEDLVHHLKELATIKAITEE